MINLYFDKPTLGGLLTDDINEIAINMEVSHEQAVFKCLETLVYCLGLSNSGEATYFDLLICACYKKKMSAPKIVLSQHGVDYKLPMLVLDTDSSLHEPTGIYLPITNQMINSFGQMFSEDFDIEYLGHEKGIQKSVRTTPINISNPTDVVYLINNESFYYKEGKFVSTSIKG